MAESAGNLHEGQNRPTTNVVLDGIKILDIEGKLILKNKLTYYFNKYSMN
jgi:hypothetical protein